MAHVYRCEPNVLSASTEALDKTFQVTVLHLAQKDTTGDLTSFDMGLSEARMQLASYSAMH